MRQWGIFSFSCHCLIDCFFYVHSSSRTPSSRTYNRCEFALDLVAGWWKQFMQRKTSIIMSKVFLSQYANAIPNCWISIIHLTLYLEKPSLYLCFLCEAIYMQQRNTFWFRRTSSLHNYIHCQKMLSTWRISLGHFMMIVSVQSMVCMVRYPGERCYQIQLANGNNDKIEHHWFSVTMDHGSNSFSLFFSAGFVCRRRLSVSVESIFWVTHITESFCVSVRT